MLQDHVDRDVKESEKKRTKHEMQHERKRGDQVEVNPRSELQFGSVNINELQKVEYSGKFFNRVLEMRYRYQDIY